MSSGTASALGLFAWTMLLGVVHARNKKTSLPLHKKLGTLLDLCVSSLRRGHANLVCIVPILSDDPRRESGKSCIRYAHIVQAQ